jgi:peptidoglycan hydrolase-like protein with peptidoglycan-binding domain
MIRRSLSRRSTKGARALLEAVAPRCRVFALLVAVVSVGALSGLEARAADPARQATTARTPTVRETQKQLKLLGYYRGVANNRRGAATVAAIKRFQADNGLTVTGRLDAATMDALFQDDLDSDESEITPPDAPHTKGRAGASATSNRGEPTEEEMKEALLRTMQMRGGQRSGVNEIGANNAIAGMTMEIVEFTKEGCQPAVRGAGYFCTYTHTSRLSLHSNDGTAAGARHANAANFLLKGIMGGTDTHTGVATRRFVRTQKGWLVSEE